MFIKRQMFGKIQHLAVLVKPREKNKHGLNKVWHWASWADKADIMFWNILEGFYQRVFPGQVDRFNKVGTDFTCKIRLFK